LIVLVRERAMGR